MVPRVLGSVRTGANVHFGLISGVRTLLMTSRMLVLWYRCVIVDSLLGARSALAGPRGE